MTFGEKLKFLRQERNLSQQEFANILGTSKQVISRYELGQTTPKIGVAAHWCELLGVNLDNMLNNSRGVYDGSTTNFDDLPSTSRGAYGFPAPQISDDVVTMPVIGDMAAGFEHIAAENWSGDTICVPESYLHGRPASDYIVLNVCGDSMYPFYLDGDKVLVLRTPALEYSGQVALVRYDGEMATLKKVEYHPGDDKMKLIPANPLYQPREITGSDLDQCSIIGIPKLVIREV